MNIPRSEYPRPQFKRDEWLCLNGEWEFEIDAGDSGEDRGILERPLNSKIIIPFCPESKLSGLNYTDFMNAVWYRRKVEIPANWNHKKLLLHFQACDYDTTVWINNQKVGFHRGGQTPFSFEISRFLQGKQEITIIVRARDYNNEYKPSGKQKMGGYKLAGTHYMRTTGIWQSVWLEPVPDIYLKRPRITPDLANSCFYIEQSFSGHRKGAKLVATLLEENKEISYDQSLIDQDFSSRLCLKVPADKLRLWEPGNPHLYDIKIELLDFEGEIIDKALCYAGMRSICLIDKKFLINGKSVFQRLVLDQGYYPQGILTAANDEDLKRDIELSMQLGFNGARLHQKVFEERFLYHADRLGYLVWGEFGDWGCSNMNDVYNAIDPWRHSPHNAMFRQWLEVLERDYNHPCIIGWCPLNETNQLKDEINSLDDLTCGLFLATKAMDTSRPVIDASGYSHLVAETDIYDSHNYNQDPKKFEEEMSGIAVNEPYITRCFENLVQGDYLGQPYFCSEFGGIKWADDKESWGYGDAPNDRTDFIERFRALCHAQLNNEYIFGYCYTQLTDVYQEKNGLLDFTRNSKFDIATISAIQKVPAAIENEKKQDK